MPDTQALRDAIIATAPRFKGLPYRLDPPPDGVTSIDCSLFILKVLAAVGIPFPTSVRTAEQERQASIPIDWDDVKAGDLVFFEGTYDAGPPSADGHIASHVGISLGKGTRQMWDAHERESSPDAVGVTVLSDWWQPKLFEARRPPGLVGADSGTPTPRPVGQLPRGIDVSSNNPHPIDWDAVAASGIAFAAIKVTEDDGYVNPYFKQDWAGAKRAGLKRLAYHFARPEGNDAVEEANYFVDMILANGTIEPGDLLVPDMESGSGDIGRWTVDFVRQVHTRTPALSVIYSGTWFTSTHSFDEPELAESPLWLAAYQDTMPAAPPPWTKVAFWQFSDAGQVPGVSGNVDVNVFNGTLAELRGLGKGGSTVSPPQKLTFVQPGDVGSGILTAMAANGTEPAMPSVFLPLGRAPAVVEECMALDGRIFRWHLPTGKLFVYPPAA